MKASIATLICLAIFNLTAEATEPPKGAGVDEVRMAVEKGLFFVEQSSMRWWKSKKCSSCHEGPALLFAHNIAKRQGFPVDQTKLDFWTDKWVLVDGLVHDRKDGRKDGGGMLGAPLTLLFRDLDTDQRPDRAETFGKLFQIVGKDWQLDDGRWDIKVGLDYIPWITLAMESFEESDMPLNDEVRADVRSRLQRTRNWIKAQKPDAPESTEDLATWVIYEHQTGNQARSQALLDELLDRQREDGTWGITAEDDGHLLVTGAALFSLTSIGLTTNHTAVRKTQRLLLDKQTENGSWHEGGRIFDDGSENEDPTYQAWATAVITAALAQSVPKLPADTGRLFQPDPKLVAASDKLAAQAAKGYRGSGSKQMAADE